MRHAKKELLRLKALAALCLLLPIAGVALSIYFTNAYNDTKHNAAMRLIEMELLHREIVKKGVQI